jgi:glyoxylase-like metal-dependent hydrolase (beta-lactamase superfamily II)
MFGINFPEEHRLDRQLETLGFKTTDVRRVVMSHLHFDHTGGLDLFPDAEGFIGTGELRYARTPAMIDNSFYRPQDLEAAGRIRWNEIPRGYDHDLFGDGSVVILSLPGHTVGALGLKVRLPDRTIVFSGDAAHMQTSIDLTIGMPFDVDSTNKNDSLRKLKLLRTQPNTTVWVNHDPDDWAKNRPNGREVV